MANLSIRNLFGGNNNSTVTNNQESNTVTQTHIQENTNVIQTAFDNARQYTKTVQAPSIDLTKEQIEAMSVRGILEEMFKENRIGITRAANETRKQGIPVLFRNRIQMDQLARALAYVGNNIHHVWEATMADDARIISLLDIKGDNDRVAIGRMNQQDGKVYYSAHYANKKYNDMGELIGLSTGDIHPVGQNIQARVNEYNAWVDSHNAAIKAVATGTASAEQVALAKDARKDDVAERFVQINIIPHINADSIINKVMIEAMLVLNTGVAFEIYTRAKNGETFSTFVDGMVEQMDFAYRSELRKLAGIKSEVVVDAQ